MATCWWRIRYRTDAIARQNVPEQNRTAGMFCPACGKGQPFSDRCTFCGCGFACFVIMQTPGTACIKRQSSDRASHGPTNQTICKQPSPSFKTVLLRFGELSLRARLIMLITAVLFIVVLTGGIKAYRSHLHQRYIYNYVQALYGIKSGIALTNRVCDGIYPAWKDGMSAPAATSIEIDSRALEDLQTIKSEIDSSMGKMGTPPYGYDQAQQILQRLYARYRSRHALTILSADDLTRCKSDTRVVNEVFARDIENLKAQMPAPLHNEFKKAGAKYGAYSLGVTP